MNDSPPLNVLVVTHYFAEHRGGVEIVAGELAERLARRGIHIEWAASKPTPPRVGEGILPLAMPAWNFAERRFGFPYPLWGPISLWRLSRAVRRADVVHLHDSLYQGNFAAYCFARLYGKPVVVTQHIGEIPHSRRITRWLHKSANRTLGRWILGRCNQTVFIAEKVREYFSQFTPFRTPSLLIPNGVDRSLFHPVDEAEHRRLREALGFTPDRPLLLFVGRFVEKKGLPVVRETARRMSQVQWLFVGWGPDDPAAWGLPNVRSVGAVEHADLPKYYRAADLLVLPSTGEGFPLVVQEAMACGTPAVISPDTARGVSNIEAVACVCELNPEELVTHLHELLSRSAELSALSSRAAAYAQRWDWDQCAAHYAELLHRLAGIREG